MKLLKTGKTYAIKWREARMFEAFILIERCSKEILNILRATGKV